MSQTQLLLIVLGVVLIGVAIYVALSMFRANAVEHARDAVINDLGHFAGQARVYFMKPSQQGGGNRSFSGVTIGRLSSMTENANGRFFVESAIDSECVIAAVGKVVSGDDSIRVRVRVTEKRNIFEIIN
jgi:hypothetical protein